MSTSQKITVSTLINASMDHVWKRWTDPQHIVQWNHASDDWNCPAASNDLRVGGQFTATMAARDGSMSFEFGGTYTTVIPNRKIAYAMSDGRSVEVLFSETNGSVRVDESFDAEGTHSMEMQRDGWQAILNNFKRHCEKA